MDRVDGFRQDSDITRTIRTKHGLKARIFKNTNLANHDSKVSEPDDSNLTSMYSHPHLSAHLTFEGMDKHG